MDAATDSQFWTWFALIIVTPLALGLWFVWLFVYSLWINLDSPKSKVHYSAITELMLHDRR